MCMKQCMRSLNSLTMEKEFVVIAIDQIVQINLLNIVDIAEHLLNGRIIAMAEYHVGCGVFAIYAGTLNSRNKNLWQNKTECTDEALCAVRDYMVQELLGGIECEKATSSGYVWKLKDGRDVELRVTIKDDSPVNGKE